MMDDATVFFGMEGGCPIHGDEHMRECGMCGVEFCIKCFRNSRICQDCASQIVGDDLDDDLESDFEDVDNLDALLEDDEEVEAILKDSEEGDPPADLLEEEEEAEAELEREFA
jgi:hypothetical protein